MRHFYAIITFLILACAPLASASAHTHVFVGVGFGCCGYYPGYYPYYYPGYYYAPAPVVYVPPPPPQVVYVSPPAAVSADQTSPTYVDGLGRTCRQFQSASGAGTACLQSDGTWRTVE